MDSAKKQFCIAPVIYWAAERKKRIRQFTIHEKKNIIEESLYTIAFA